MDRISVSESLPTPDETKASLKPPIMFNNYHDRWNQNRSLPPVPTIDHNLYSIQSDNDSLLH
ncbi:hypothetical protein V1477_000170 [Vespula maculifrons]|uniref:Uncharacterized protein n=1 Tax=Vespula maculifrons TaxID=7453 RepID=A0ABD2B113_VESMC